MSIIISSELGWWYEDFLPEEYFPISTEEEVDKDAKFNKE